MAADILASQRYLVTGGTGFVGGAIVDHLRGLGATVRVLVRASTDASHLERAGVEIARGDIRDPLAVEAATRGCRGLFHAAALAGWVRAPKLYEPINVGGTINVLAAARSASVERVVHVSSVAAIGEPAGVVAREETPHRGSFLREYERTKFLAEERARRAAGSGLAVVVVNPTGVIGPRGGGITGSVFRAYVSRRLPTLPRPENRINLVHVDDVASGTVAAYRRGRVGQRYILGGENLTIGKMFALCEELTGVASPTRTLPDPVTWTVALVSEAIARLTRGVPRLTRDMLRVARHGMAADSSKAREELGYVPRSARDALLDTLRWYVDQEDVTIR